MSEKFATQDPANPKLCIMPSGVRVSHASAKAQGYTVKDSRAIGRDIGHTGEALADFAKSFDRAIELASRSAEQTTHLASVLALPEAKSRPSAAARIAASNTEARLPVAKAQAFLRGLPEESAPPAPSTAMTDDMRVFRRKAAIRVSTLNYNASNGNKSAAREAAKLSNAMRVFDEGGVSLQQALTSAGLDARATLRSIIGA